MLVSKAEFALLYFAESRLLLFLCWLPARPKPDTSRTEKTSIQIDEPATVDGTTLAPGQYEIVIEGNKATFEHNGQTVVTAPIDWKATTYKSPYDSVTYSSNRALQEIQFEGSDEALEVM